MTLSQADIANAIEISMFSMPLHPGKMEAVEIDGLTGIYVPSLAYAMLNVVGLAKLNADNIDAKIEEVIKFFKNLDHQVSWITSETSTPSNINQKLEHHGFQKIFDLAGLYLDDFDRAMNPNPDVVVRLALDEDIEHITRLYSEAYPMPADVIPSFMDNIVAINGRNYLAYVEDSDDPVSIATMFYMPNMPIVALQGAATLPDYRGRGIYTSLMAKRLQDARADGMQVAIMQGDVKTSAPICMKLGFEKVCDMAIYTWSEGEEETH
jgi:predicted GNAT family acetyltransferase